jgi:hypothetical protein
VGRYEGVLNIYNADSIVNSLPMRLNLLPTDSANEYRWQIQYDTQTFRNYYLRLTNASTGEYEVDENNEITLTAHIHSRLLTSYFTVMQSTLLVTYDFRISDQITYSVHAYGKTPHQYTGQDNPEIDSVGLYPFIGYQEAVLKRID